MGGLSVPGLMTETPMSAAVEARFSNLEKDVRTLKMESGGSVIKPGTDNPPIDQPPKPSGGLTIGG